MATAPAGFNYFRRNELFPSGNTKLALDYFRRVAPILPMGQDVVAGLVLGGAASVIGISFTYFPTGNCKLGGSASVSTYYNYSISAGNAVLGNSGPVVYYLNYASTGNAVFGGAAAASLVDNSTTFNYTAGGKITTGETSFVSIVYTASGNGQFGGTAGKNFFIKPYGAMYWTPVTFKSRLAFSNGATYISSYWQYVASGGLNAKGGANVASSSWNYEAVYWTSGPESAFRIGGQGADYHPLNRQFNYVAQFWAEPAPPYLAAIQIDGGDPNVAASYHRYIAQYLAAPSPPYLAGITTNGHSEVAFNLWYYYASGGPHVRSESSQKVYRSIVSDPKKIITTVDADIVFYKDYNASGGLRLDGAAANVKFSPNYTPSGGLRLGSGAVVGNVLYASYIAGGKIKTGNAAQLHYTYTKTTGNARFGGAANVACSYHAYTAIPSGLGLYAPSYYELIYHEQPLGFWIRQDSVGTTLVNGGTSSEVASLTGSPTFQLTSLIPNQGDGYSMRFDTINTCAVLNSVEFNDNELTKRSISLVFSADDTTLRSCLYDEGNTINGLNLYIVNGEIHFHVWRIDPPIFESHSLSYPINVGQAYHVVAIFDPVNNAMTLYVDGIFVGTEGVVVSSLTSRPNLAFGAKYGGTRYNDTNGGFAASFSSPGQGHWLRGNLQAVAVWDRILSADEIALQRNSLAARYYCFAGVNYQLFPSGNGVLGNTADAELIIIGPAYYNPTIGGNAVFGGFSSQLVDHWYYTGEGNSVLGNTADASLLFGVYEGDGHLTTGVNASGKIIFTYLPSGGINFSGEAFAGFEFDAEQEFTWNISQGILRYYRIEGMPRPYGCPPVGGSSVCSSDQCVQYFFNVSARSLADLCEKLRRLRFNGQVRRVQVFSRPVLKSDEDPNINYDCNELTDIDLPHCDDLFLGYDLVVTAEAISYAIMTKDFSYDASGCVSTNIDSIKVFNDWRYVAGGGMKFSDGATINYDGLVIVAGNGLVSFGGGATYSTNALGLQLVEAEALAYVLAVDINFGTETGNPLTLPVEAVVSGCCGNLPSLLYFNHELGRCSKLNNFLAINSLNLQRNLKLVYSSKKNIWINNIHLKGIGTSNDLETWDITSEFGCIDNLEGIQTIDGTVWGVSVTIVNKNTRTRTDNYTRIVLNFDPLIVCTLDRALDNTFFVNVRNKETSPTAIRAIVLYDEIGLFKNRSFIVDPIIKFRVTSTALASPIVNVNLSNSLQELLL